MRKLVMSILAMSAMVVSTFAASSCYKADSTAAVTWKAFKTPEKVGVGGSFDNVVLKAPSVGASAHNVLKGASVTIVPASVNTKNPERDAKLVASFFDLLAGDTITAKVVDVKNDSLDVAITLNGVTKTVAMHYRLQEQEIYADGVIDLLDFSASKALASINQACYELHKGKTWSDVEIGFYMTLSRGACQ